MKPENDHAGVYIPPPFIFLAIYLIAWLTQLYFPIANGFFMQFPSKIMGGILIGLGMFVGGTGALRFAKNKTTILTHKPVAFLQTGGIYSYTRNPMYLGLLLAYTGFGCWMGNWWVIIFIPFSIFIITNYVIRKEEMYLHRAFGKQYDDYKDKVRRWI